MVSGTYLRIPGFRRLDRSDMRREVPDTRSEKEEG